MLSQFLKSTVIFKLLLQRKYLICHFNIYQNVDVVSLDKIDQTTSVITVSYLENVSG